MYRRCWGILFAVSPGRRSITLQFGRVQWGDLVGAGWIWGGARANAVDGLFVSWKENLGRIVVSRKYRVGMSCSESRWIVYRGVSESGIDIFLRESTFLRSRR